MNHAFANTFMANDTNLLFSFKESDSNYNFTNYLRFNKRYESSVVNISWVLNLLNAKEKALFDAYNSLSITEDTYSFLDLTHSVDVSDDIVMINRIDRLSFTFYFDNADFTLGREAVTWSQSRLFHVYDFFHPQTPKEYEGFYKPGSDILSFRYLFSDGSNLTFIASPQKDDMHDITIEATTLGIKYFGSGFYSDYTFGIARYLDDSTVFFSYSTELGTYILRNDTSLWYTQDAEKYWLSVFGVEYSTVFFTKDVLLYMEYYHNSAGSHNPKQNTDNQFMDKRLQRGNTFLRSKNYLGAAMIFDITQHFKLASFGFVNLYSGTLITSFGVNYDINQQVELSATCNLLYFDSLSEVQSSCSDLKLCSKSETQAVFQLGMKATL